jgi:hypothetical protein
VLRCSFQWAGAAVCAVAKCAETSSSSLIEGPTYVVVDRVALAYSSCRALTVRHWQLPARYGPFARARGCHWQRQRSRQREANGFSGPTSRASGSERSRGHVDRPREWMSYHHAERDAGDRARPGCGRRRQHTRSPGTRRSSGRPPSPPRGAVERLPTSARRPPRARRVGVETISSKDNCPGRPKAAELIWLCCG